MDAEKQAAEGRAPEGHFQRADAGRKGEAGHRAYQAPAYGRKKNADIAEVGLYGSLRRVSLMQCRTGGDLRCRFAALSSAYFYGYCLSFIHFCTRIQGDTFFLHGFFRTNVALQNFFSKTICEKVETFGNKKTTPIRAGQNGVV
jgi:hypothetical protein